MDDIPRVHAIELADLRVFRHSLCGSRPHAALHFWFVLVAVGSYLLVMLSNRSLRRDRGIVPHDRRQEHGLPGVTGPRSVPNEPRSDLQFPAGPGGSLAAAKRRFQPGLWEPKNPVGSCWEQEMHW